MSLFAKSVPRESTDHLFLKKEEKTDIRSGEEDYNSCSNCTYPDAVIFHLKKYCFQKNT